MTSFRISVLGDGDALSCAEKSSCRQQRRRERRIRKRKRELAINRCVDSKLTIRGMKEEAHGRIDTCAEVNISSNALARKLNLSPCVDVNAIKVQGINVKPSMSQLSISYGSVFPIKTGLHVILKSLFWVLISTGNLHWGDHRFHLLEPTTYTTGPLEISSNGVAMWATLCSQTVKEGEASSFLEGRSCWERADRPGLRERAAR